MTELQRHIGEDTDVPAGDIGVGAREVSYLFGQYKRLTNRFVGVITGKGLSFGGSLIRTEATGYGVAYFIQDMLAARGGDSFEGKTVAISGSGNVAIYAVEKVNDLGGKVVTLSDSSGSIYDPEGIDAEKLAYIKDLKEVRRGRIREYADKFGCEYRKGANPWGVACDVAIPCATQNELEAEDARTLLDNGCTVVAEGANMPCTLDAVHLFHHAKILFGPAKAANAGGVAVSGLEQSQNAPAHVVEPRGGRPAARHHHGADPRQVRRLRPERRRLGRLRQGREPRRLRQGRRRDAGLRDQLIDQRGRPQLVGVNPIGELRRVV